MQDTNENGTDSMISRILMVSPDQSELFKRNKSRIFIGVESESMIDTILNQVHRPIETYIEVSHRAIALCNLQDSYGDIRAVDGMSMMGGGIAFLTTTDWLKDDQNNVFDLYLSLDPDYEPAGTPNVKIMSTAQIDDGIEGENPLILSCDIEQLFQSNDDSDMSASSAQHGSMQSQGEDTRDQTNQPQSQDTNQTTGQSSGNGQHSDMSKNDAAISERRSTNTGGEVPAGRGDDQDRQPGGQGRVKSEADGRLKENRDQGMHIDGTTNASNDHAEVGGQGRVQNPDDGRLKANIDAGVKIGDGDNKNTEQQADANEKTPAMARQNQGEGEGGQAKRGRVTSPHDRRLRRNRGK